MAKPKDGLVVIGTLKGVTPKHQAGDEWIGNRRVPKGNLLQLLVEVRVPAPEPAKPRGEWEQEQRTYDFDNKVREIKQAIAAVDRDEPDRPKLPRGKHYFTPIEGLNAPVQGPAVCRVCEKTQEDRDTGKCVVFDQDDAVRELREQLEALNVEHQDAQVKAYAKYVLHCERQTAASLRANMGTGLFFSLLGQEVRLDLRPSNRVFQPLLDALAAMPTVPALPSGEDDDQEQDDDEDDEE